MTTIYLIRHAEADGNLYRVCQGQVESSITERGYAQIDALERRFAGMPIAAVYCSDLYRTSMTATALARSRGLQLQRRRGLREICVGEWEHRPWGEIARKDSRQMMNFLTNLKEWSVPGGERPEAVQQRMLTVLREIGEANEGKAAAAFSHGCAIRLTLAYLQGVPLSELDRTPLGNNTAVSCLEYEDGAFRVVYRDDDSHLNADSNALRRMRWRKTANGMEAGLYYQNAEDSRRFAEEWERGGFVTAEERPDWEQLLRSLDEPILCGLLEGEERPVGFAGFAPEREREAGRGWISALTVRPEKRCMGYGVQLLGQAISFYRAREREALCVALSEGNSAARSFFAEYGFVPTERRDERGREIWERSITFPPLGVAVSEIL